VVPQEGGRNRSRAWRGQHERVQAGGEDWVEDDLRDCEDQEFGRERAGTAAVWGLHGFDCFGEEYGG